jgi:predicted regulator of Ras-like GTPase activity (Roadblock/LC7/MglB family)
MVKKKQGIQEAETTVIVDDDDELSATPEDDQTFTDLSNKLAEIRKDKGVIGYIIRNTTSATIDLKEPEKIVEYAIFSSQVLDSSQEISDLFELGDVSSVLIEGKESKALCMNIEGNKISIFMEKDADDADILKQISP